MMDMRQTRLNFPQKRPAVTAESYDDREIEKRHKGIDSTTAVGGGSMTVILDNGLQVCLSPDQEHIVNLALAGHHLFFTGAGGVGKSLTLKALVQKLREKHGKSRVYVTASTGVAACNIDGTTLHSFAGVGLGKGTLEQLLKKARSRSDTKQRWANARVLIIDEISMIDPEFFEMLDLIARRLRSGAGGKNSLFGGIQIILAGDFLQLPYVRDGEESKSDQIFLFETKTWKLLFPDTPEPSGRAAAAYAKNKQAADRVITAKDLSRRGHMIHLTKVFRQKERDFISTLQSVRLGKQTPEQLESLRSRVNARIDCSDGIRPTRLYPHRFDVQRENNIELHQLPGEIHQFSAIDNGEEGALKAMDKHCQAPKLLELKVGAQVLLVRNLDFVRQLVNGSRGVVVDFVPPVSDASQSTAGAKDKKTPNYTGAELMPLVKFASGEMEIVSPVEWKIESGDVVLCSRVQVPLTLGWASSIHKAMGMTLDRVETKLGSVFEYGQFYTSVSRVTSLEGLSLIGDFDNTKIMAHPRVVEFYNYLDQRRN